VRIEDVDIPRCLAGADAVILSQLGSCGLMPDEPPVRQSSRSAVYAAGLERLLCNGLTYPCACTRNDIARAQASAGRLHRRHDEWIYPGTCRPEKGGLVGRPGRSVRLRIADGTRIAWTDRRLGPQSQDLATAVGDFVLHRADGLWAYQLAVVLDDAAQGISDVVRGEDLCDNTPRQIHLQRLLGLPTPRYLHTPLVLGADGEKLSKQNGAEAVDLSDPVTALRRAGVVLGVASAAATLGDWLAEATQQWRERWCTEAGMMRSLATPRDPRS